jgi:hypothetical protein
VKKKFQERIRKVKVPLYEFVVVELVLTNDMRASEDRRGIKDDERGVAHTLGDGSGVLVMLRDTMPLRDIAHEAVHVATHVLRQAGVKAGLKNDEAIAYLVDWFVSWIENVR